MPRDDQRWKAPGEAWGTYREAVEAWLEVAPDPVADPAVIDVLTHELIAEHNEWSEGLGAVLRASHRHWVTTSGRRWAGRCALSGGVDPLRDPRATNSNMSEARKGPVPVAVIRVFGALGPRGRPA